MSPYAYEPKREQNEAVATPETVHDRLRRLIAEAIKAAGTNEAETQFLKRNGISTGYMGVIAKRLKKNANAKISLPYAVKLARALGVTAEYINDGVYARFAGIDTYENRARAMMAARLLDYPEDAVRHVLTLNPGVDQPVAWWMNHIKAEFIRLRPTADL